MFQRCRVANMARTRIEKCDCVIATEQDGDGTEIGVGACMCHCLCEGL